MKNLKLFLMVISFLGILSCEEEDQLRPFKQGDSVAPGAVTDVQVENLPGAAKLTYNLPTDEDLLYVEAHFKRKSDGEMNIVKASIYDNTLLAEGFGDTSQYDITLYAVDNGENKSAPTVVQANPLTPPIESIYATLDLVADFGGVHVYWENESRAPISITVLTPNEIGVMEQVDVRYSSLVEGDFAIRGYEAEPRVFRAFIKDRFDNITDIKEVTITPLFEEEFDYNMMQAITQPHDAPYAFGWAPDRIVDNNTGSGYHSGQGVKDPDPLPEYEGTFPHMITIDMGALGKLSRIKWWQRQGTRWVYYHGNPRIYDVWGTDELNADGSFDGWTLMAENVEVIKPSGQPGRVNSSEDLDAAAAGEEVSIPASVPPVRYVRFVTKVNWAGSEVAFTHIMEMKFFGALAD